MLTFYLVMVSLIPLTMVVIGLSWKKWRSPKEVNYIYGYRTPRSMKSRATWEFAHCYFGGIWLRTGLPIWLISLALLFAYRGADKDALGNVVLIISYVQVVCMMLPIIPTEIELKKRFDEHGNPRVGQ